jgi:hypothetical protein
MTTSAWSSASIAAGVCTGGPVPGATGPLHSLCTGPAPKAPTIDLTCTCPSSSNTATCDPCTPTTKFNWTGQDPAALPSAIQSKLPASTPGAPAGSTAAANVKNMTVESDGTTPLKCTKACGPTTSAYWVAAWKKKSS